MVKENTVRKCLKAGVLNSNFSFGIQPFSFEDDPFADLNNEQGDREENDDW